jgi:hypothetical protein
MRSAPCLKGVHPPRRAGARSRWGIILAIAVVLGAAPPVRAQADKGIIDDREDRVNREQSHLQAQQAADTEVWSTAKIVINLDARCPVVTTLGFFAAFATGDQDPAKAAEEQSRYTQLQAAAQPISEEMKKMVAATKFTGQTFPADLDPKLRVLCGQLYAAVAKLYGDDALGELKQYVATLSQGSVVGLQAPTPAANL